MRTPAPDPSKSAEVGRRPPMANYVRGLLRRVPGRPKVSDAEAEAIQEGHLAHLRHLREAGFLVVSGPMLDDGDLRGVLIFRGDSLEEVRRLSESDPALKNHRLLLELHELYRPAGLQVVSSRFPQGK